MQHYETQVGLTLRTMHLRACALAMLLTVTASQGFYFSKTTDVFRRTETCQMCYHEQCLNMETARCEYYLLSDEMLQRSENLETRGVRMKANDDDDNLKIKADLDEALFDLVEKASDASDKECIPYISRYTDCTKENICLGCTACDCSAEGSWVCSDVQLCRAEKTTNIDHRVLLMVIENLLNKEERSEDKITKSKRSVTEDPLNSSTNKITFEELSEWWYGVKPLEHDHIYEFGHTTAKIDVTTIGGDVTTLGGDVTSVGGPTEIANRTTMESGPQTTAPTTETSIIPDPDNLAFEEVLSNIGIDTKKYVRRKLPMDLVQNDTMYDVDYMFLNEMKPMHNRNISDLIPNMLSLVEDIEDDGIEGTTGEASKVVIDLLESAKTNNRNIKNVTDYMKMYKDSLGLNPPFENTNDIIEYDAVNIMKRDISYSENVTDTANVTTAKNTNTTEHKCHMNDTIITSLSNLINDMHRELKELQGVKGNLIHFVKSYTKNLTNEHNKTIDDVNDKYNLENTSTVDENLRKNNPSMLDKYMEKLKRDIYQVLRDIVGIQKYKRGAEFRDDLKILIRSMKHYISNNGIPGMKLNQITLNRFSDLRRYWSIYRHSTSPKDNIIRIFNIIDKEMPEALAIDSLSATARKIVIRVIKHYYVDDFSAVGLRAHDSSYNLTNDLRSVGTKWQKIAADTENSSPFEKPYTMKLLHFELVKDINKVKDALALVDFAHSRRVIPLFRHIETRIIENISTSLKAINDKLSMLLQFNNNRISKKSTLQSSKKIILPTSRIVKDDVDDRGEKRKKSFLKKIRNILKGSKKDIVELMNKRVPKADIVKKIARKKMSELAQKRYNEYEETMLKWQKNLNVRPRRKRSMLDTNGFRTRMKNIIIPKYLRGKVDGKIVAKKKKNVNTLHNQTKPKGNTKTGNGKGNRTTQKTNSVAPKLTTPVTLGDY